MVEVKRAYRNSGGTLTYGSVVATIKYDGLGRRIVKDIDRSGDWDCEYHYYYAGQRMIETRNGSDCVLKQHVHGYMYIDEIVQIATNDDPADENENTCETHYWPMQDANFNVLGIVESDGTLKERYEYTPYGQRTIYKSAGTNDPICMSAILESQRVEVSGVNQPYSICDKGHQGLTHDKEFGWVYNRARYLIPNLGKFNSRDPRGYINGMNLYEYVGSAPVGSLDPSGTVVILVHGVNAGDDVPKWYGIARKGLNKYWEDSVSIGLTAKKQRKQKIIGFLWGDNEAVKVWTRKTYSKLGGRANYATNSVAEMYKKGGALDRSYMPVSVNRLKKVIDDLNKAKKASKSKEPITVIAHSQGTIITLGAIHKGARIDNFIMMGSPLSVYSWNPHDSADRDERIREKKEDVYTVNKNHDLNHKKVISGVRGSIFNYWSRNDQWAGFYTRGAIGVAATGSRTDTVDIIKNNRSCTVRKYQGCVSGVKDQEFAPNRVVYRFMRPGADVPTGVQFGKDRYRHSGYMRGPKIFTYVHARDVASAPDTDLSDCKEITGIKNYAEDWK